MAKELPNIEYTNLKSDNSVPVVDSITGLYHIPYYKDLEFFSNIESYVAFIKGCESLVRKNDRYKKYIYYLKNVLGLDYCQVLPKVETDDKGAIEIDMHHGPIFTLYDYCEIILEYFLYKKWKVNTFRIANAVLDEHFANRIQVVFLLATVHEEVHNKEIFINYKQGFGDLYSFIKRYGVAISDQLKEKLNRYIDRSILYDSNDFGILKLNELVLKIS